MSTPNGRTVAMSDGLLILDDDPILVKHIIAEFEESLPVTLTIETNNGIHHYFQRTGSSGQTPEVPLANTGGKQ